MKFVGGRGRQHDRPKGRPPRWAFRVTAGGTVAFESAWVSIRYAGRDDAAWLAGLIDASVADGSFPGCPGHSASPTLAPIAVPWEGNLDNDCWASVGSLTAHAELSHGPRRGGAWYCSVHRPGERLLHTADCGVQPRSGGAARWLCEMVMDASRRGGDPMDP